MTRPPWITPPIEESLDLWSAARRTDPPTSHAAGAKVPQSAKPPMKRTSIEAAARKEEFAPTHKGYIYRALAVGPAGQTEIARRVFANPPHVALLPHQIGKRLSELVVAGLIAEDGEERNPHGNLETRYRRTT